MARQLIGGNSSAILETDATFLAARVTIRPQQVINWQSNAAVSGALTGVAAAGAVFSFRNTGSNLILVRRVALGFVTTTAFTTAQGLTYNLFRANGFTVSDSGGTVMYTAGANKHRNSFTNITSAPDIRISAAAALTAGTRTLEGQPMGVLNGSSTAVGTSMAIQNIFSHDPEDYPLVLAQNEGLVITNGIAMGAVGVINLQCLIEYAEVTSF